jgi:hypothetical protein
MEVADVRKAVLDAMARARQRAADRRARADASARSFESLLSHVVAPLLKQIAGVLRAENYPSTVSTPAGIVRLSSDKNADDFIEIFLDTNGETPRVAARTSWRRGRQVIVREQPIGSGDPETIGERTLLDFLLTELEPFVER